MRRACVAKQRRADPDLSLRARPAIHRVRFALRYHGGNTRCRDHETRTQTIASIGDKITRDDHDFLFKSKATKPVCVLPRACRKGSPLVAGFLYIPSFSLGIAG